MFTLNSCKNANHNQLAFDEINLKSILENKDSQTEWTTELEKNRLSQKISSIDYVRSSISLTPEAMIAFESGASRTAVFPSLDGFGSLDISDVDSSAILLINQFCNDLNQEKNVEHFMSDDSVFSLVLFYYDLAKIDFDCKKFDWIIGKAYNFDEGLEIPVRLKNDKKFVDVKFYLIQPKLKEESRSATVQLDYKILDFEIFNFKNIDKILEGSDGK